MTFFPVILWQWLIHKTRISLATVHSLRRSNTTFRELPTPILGLCCTSDRVTNLYDINFSALSLTDIQDSWSDQTLGGSSSHRDQIRHWKGHACSLSRGAGTLMLFKCASSSASGSTQTEEGSTDGPRNSVCKRRNSTMDTTQLNKAIRPALVLSICFTPPLSPLLL